MNRRHPLSRNRLFVILLVAGLAIYQYYQSGYEGSLDATDSAVQSAYNAQRSGVWLETQGHVGRVLGDDNEGSRHQRFILNVGDGHTVLVAHNIDLARRIPARKNMVVRVRGRYEWNDRGGVIHWTHHDPDGRQPGGWIEVDGERYD